LAERRMFAKTIVLSDAFLDMPLSARCLYFTFGMIADDDGFVNSPKAIIRQCGAAEDDIKLLIAKRFVLPFESGVIVIKHWRINNYLRNDRYTPTKYAEELDKLSVEVNGAYTESERDGIPNSGIPSIGKDSIDNTLDDFQSSDVEAFFNSLWALYPRKEGKGAVSKTKKQKLYRIGFEEMQRTIERYKAKLKAEGTEKQFIQHGSTFFNSGYVDFLDENYETAKSPPAPKPRKGHLVKIINDYGREEEVWRED